MEISENRCGFVALVGAPNAGKSTLLNQLVGAKVSIVSRKVQTTRTRVRGIVMEDQTQIVFVDTPGLFRPKRNLEKAMVTSALGGAGEADIVAMLVDVRLFDAEETEEVFEAIEKIKQPVVLVLNKIDLIARDKLMLITQALNEKANFAATFMISAMTGSGVDGFIQWLAKKLPVGHWHYPADQITDAPLRFFAAEVTREKLFERLHDELPYKLTVETESWKVMNNGSIRVDQVIYVERENQRKILLGEKGQTIKSVGAAARKDIGEAADATVHLFLFVKVRENWSKDPERYREMGLELPKK